MSYFVAYPKIKTFDIARKNLIARGFFGKGMIMAVEKMT
jgi:hypothetical protein